MLQLQANFVAADDTGAVLHATNVETSAGTKVSANTSVIIVDDNTAPTIDRAKSSINANGTLTLGFSESVNAVAAGTLSDLVLSVNGSTVTVGNGNVAMADGTGSDVGKYVVITFTTYVTTTADASGKFYEYLDVDGDDVFDPSDIVVTKRLFKTKN